MPSTLRQLSLTNSAKETSASGSENGTVTNADDSIYTPSQTTEEDTGRYAMGHDESDPPEGYTPVVPVCSHYDLILELVNPVKEEDGQSWGVSQAAICLSSPVFKRLLSRGDAHDPNIARFVRNGVDVLRITATDLIWGKDEVLDATIVRCILYPIHLSADGVPQVLNASRLSRVCTFAQSFQLMPALKPWLTLWTQNLSAPTQLPKDLRPWLVITNVLGNKAKFRGCQMQYWWNVTRHELQLHISLAPSLLLPFFKTTQLLIEESHAEIFDRWVQIYYWLLNPEADLLREEKDRVGVIFTSCPHLGSACDDTRLGGLTRPLFTKLMEHSAEDIQTADRDVSLAHLWARVARECSESLVSTFAIHSAVDARRSYVQAAFSAGTAFNCDKKCKAEFVQYWNQWLDGRIARVNQSLHPLVDGEVINCQPVPTWWNAYWLDWTTLTPRFYPVPNKRELAIF